MSHSTVSGQTAQYLEVPASPSGVPTIYFDSGRNCYLIQNSRAGWVSINETQLKRQLKPFLRSKPNEDEALSPLDAYLNRLQTHCDVAYAGPLAGHWPGVLDYEGRRLLITEGPCVIEPKVGEWPLLNKVIENLLVDEQADQRPYFYGWLKVAREALNARAPRPGQVLVMAGPRACGKSLLQNLITPLLGKRAAKPYGWMTQATDFNGELFGAEHLIIEDEAASTDIRARRNFAAALKGVTVNTVQKCHAKNRSGISLEPFWRVSITVNDEPENLMVLPPLDDSIGDKLILLRANKQPMPMATGTTEERREFMRTLTDELPAFCAFLDDWQIPTELLSQRFGITHFHHPELVSAIDDLAPETRLWQLIETEILPGLDQWTGTAAELERRLLSGDASVAHEARKVLTYPNAGGTYLGRLSKKRPKQVINDRTPESRNWVIKHSLTG